LAQSHRDYLTVDNTPYPSLYEGRKKTVQEVCHFAMGQADRRMHKNFAINQVGKDAWFQPVEKLIGRPELVCDRSGRWHENSNKRIGLTEQVISASAQAKGKRLLSCRFSVLRS
jgi:hypothetical protein